MESIVPTNVVYAIVISTKRKVPMNMQDVRCNGRRKRMRARTGSPRPPGMRERIRLRAVRVGSIRGHLLRRTAPPAYRGHARLRADPYRIRRGRLPGTPSQRITTRLARSTGLVRNAPRFGSGLRP